MDVLSAKPEYIDFNKNGKTFVALKIPPEPISPHTWWDQMKWYFYAAGFGISGLILLFSLCWLCTCADCCLPKFLFKPCRSLVKRSTVLSRKKKFRRELEAQPLNIIQETSQPLIVTIPPIQNNSNKEPLLQMQSQRRHSEIIMLPINDVRYYPQVSPSNSDVKVQSNFRSYSPAHSLSESSRKPKQHRVSKQRDVALKHGGMLFYKFKKILNHKLLTNNIIVINYYSDIIFIIIDKRNPF